VTKATGQRASRIAKEPVVNDHVDVPPDGYQTNGTKGISYLRDYFIPALIADAFDVSADTQV
jgi:hypothetical protein